MPQPRLRESSLVNLDFLVSLLRCFDCGFAEGFLLRLTLPQGLFRIDAVDLVGLAGSVRLLATSLVFPMGRLVPVLSVAGFIFFISAFNLEQFQASHRDKPDTADKGRLN